MELDRAHRRKLLVLAPFPPARDAAHGGALAMAELLMELSTRQRVAILALRGRDDRPIDPALHERCEFAAEIPRRDDDRAGFGALAQRLGYAVSLARGRPRWPADWRSSAFARRLRVAVDRWKPDLLQFEFHLMGQYAEVVRGHHAPRILVEHEPGVTLVHGLPAGGIAVQRLRQRLETRAWERYERRVTEAVSTVVVFTERDRAALSPLSPRTPIVRIPLGARVPCAPVATAEQGPPSLLFVGNFMHPPNVDAALRLVRDIAPALRSNRPELDVWVVGDRPPGELLALAGERVHVPGRVPEIEPYLERATVVVTPIRTGGGMRVKVLEALAAGKATVATPLAVEGLDIVDGEQLMLAETDGQFASKIAELLDDPARRQELGQSAHRWAQANLSWEAVADRYEALYDELLGVETDAAASRRHARTDAERGGPHG